MTDSQHWATRRDNVKDSQNRQCLFCGRPSVRHRRLEIHHVRKLENGGTDALRNLVAVCHACHKFTHNAERNMPAVSRLILILQVLWPESLLIAWVSRFLFARFLYSPAGSSFHPAALALRPASATCTAVLACLFAAAFTVSAQDMPLPNPAILTIQAEAQGRERAVARQIDYQVAKATPPKAAAEPKAPRHLTPMEVRELMAALDAYFREHAGRVPVFWTPEARP